MKEILDPVAARRILAELKKRHSEDLGDSELSLEGHREGQRLLARLTLTNRDKTVHYPMEAGVSLDGDTLKEEEEALATALEFLFGYLEQYFTSGGEVLLPIDWEPVDCGERALFARGWERNLALEEAADKWLAGEPVEVETTWRKGKR